MTTAAFETLTLEQFDALLPDFLATIRHIKAHTLPQIDTQDALNQAEDFVGTVRYAVDTDDERFTFADVMHQQAETFGHAAMGALGTLNELEILIERPELLQEAARNLHAQLKTTLLAGKPPLSERGAAVARLHQRCQLCPRRCTAVPPH